MTFSCLSLGKLIPSIRDLQLFYNNKLHGDIIDFIGGEGGYLGLYLGKIGGDQIKEQYK